MRFQQNRFVFEYKKPHFPLYLVPRYNTFNTPIKLTSALVSITHQLKELFL